jgi:hypothetical protein
MVHANLFFPPQLLLLFLSSFKELSWKPHPATSAYVSLVKTVTGSPLAIKEVRKRILVTLWKGDILLHFLLYFRNTFDITVELTGTL